MRIGALNSASLETGIPRTSVAAGLECGASEFLLPPGSWFNYQIHRADPKKEATGIDLPMEKSILTLGDDTVLP